ncbi:hypothetical protein KIN20_007926 [Parelaphostrongylus tenuis]|uniref:SCP domain-containing protein n=1 Tax=Parelaphostrongylus tenuis TaxID=148309 RepID=A0AAD5MM30_PARTN|nr:hypothetical protein KIN20_007926 [Parelaphostrongylus tenuis]
MNSFLFAVVLVAGCKLSHSEESSARMYDYSDYADNSDYGGDKGEKEQCDNNTNMTPDLRFSIRVDHNRLRIHLANGTHKNGNGDSAGNFPQASDMSLVEYDCGLEKLAFNISQLCHNNPKIKFAGGNTAVYSGNVNNFKSSINDLIMRWWNTSIENPPLVNLTPTQNNTER